MNAHRELTIRLNSFEISFRDVVRKDWAYLDTADPDVEEDRRILYRFVTTMVFGKIQLMAYYVFRSEITKDVFTSVRIIQGHTNGLFYPQGMESHAIAKVRLFLFWDLGKPKKILDNDIFMRLPGRSALLVNL